MKKKIFSLLLTGLLVCSMTGCSTLANVLGSSSESSASSSVSSQPSSSSEAVSTTEKQEAASSEVAESSVVTTAVTVSSAETNDYILSDDINVSTDGAQEVILNGDSIEFSGTGAKANGTTFEITSAGTYIFSGTLNDGQIFVEEDNKGQVHLILNGVSISNSSSAAIYIKNSGKTIITLVDGTENYLSDGTSYTNVVDEEPSACLFSKDDLTINGGGNLTIAANYNDGITCKDDLKIVSGSYNITAVDDGIIGRDLLVISDANINISAGGDGMKATNDTTESSGNVILLGGTANIETGADGIQAVTSLLVEGGSYNIVTGGGSANAPQKQGDFGFFMGSTNTEEESSSQKGLKSSVDININGGTITIDASDDAVHSNNNINVSGGDFVLASGDDGIHADNQLNIIDGNILITKSYEGLEGTEINIGGGVIDLTASDDGLNAAGGADSSNMNSFRGGDMFSGSSGTLTISGGTVTVNAGGDGLDSNGNFYMTGGYVVVHGPTDNGNGALDYDGSFSLDGGVLMAGGSSGMMQSQTQGSALYSILVGANQNAGAVITIENSSGETILSYTAKKTIQCVLFASQDIKQGETYTAYANGSSLGQCTINSTCTSIGSVSAGMGGSMGGNMGGEMGGMRR